MALIIVAGASGQHAAVVYEAAILSGMTVFGFATVATATPTPLLDCRWVGSIGSTASEIDRGTQFIVACGSNQLRRELSESLLAKGVSLGGVRHPTAIGSPSASIAPGSALLAGAIVGPRAALGRGVIINHAASVDHDCQIGDYANVSPGARWGGCVYVESGVFAGLKASIIQGLRLGEGAIIGAGAVVTRNLELGATVVGIPARLVRQR